MQKLLIFITFIASITAMAQQDTPPIHKENTYLQSICDLCKVQWPKNRTINIVCHGHSVPSGYFKTPTVNSLESYPNLLRIALAKQFPYAVINIIVTGIGGETSDKGAARFTQDVLSHKPDLITIDYALNDRRIGLEKAKTSWESMIQEAKAAGVKVLLLTPTPDLSAKLDSKDDPLCQHAEQIRALAKKYNIGLVDSLLAFQNAISSGEDPKGLMSQRNHPNEKGHQIVAQELMKWFKF